MCRNIRTLHSLQPPATEDEIQASALRYVRKISGGTRPPRASEQAFADAVEPVAEATRLLPGQPTTAAAPKNREVEAEKARARYARRRAA
jgi:hypothetical protein